MATIKDVAEKAGVSVATVSYVLNGTRKVLPETQRRIRAAVRQLGYSPNAAARNLAVGRSNILGLVVPDIRNPFFPEITAAFQEAANLSDMEVIVMNTNSDPERTRNTFERLLSLQVRGAGFFTSQIPHAIRRQLAEKRIPAVYLDHAQAGPFISNLEIDYHQGIFDAFEHVRGLGHQRIGFIGGPAHGRAARLRKRAFLEAAASAGPIETRAIDSDFTVQGGYSACSKLLAEFAPTAIIAANDLMAIGAMHCVCDRGIAVPGSISIVGFDDILFAQYTQPALTTVAVSRSEIGRVAYEALTAIAAAPTEPGKEYPVKTELVVRQSTAPAR